MSLIQRTPIRLTADPGRVILRFLDFGRAERFLPVIEYIQSLPEEEVNQQWQSIRNDFTKRHYDFEGVIRQHIEKLRAYIPANFSLTQQLLSGAYFSLEYSLQASALFNPSIVIHPDQTGVEPGAVRFIMSLRATGEGHISSVVFRTGVIFNSGEIRLDPPAAALTCGTKYQDPGNKDEAEYKVHFPEDVSLSGRVLFPSSPAESSGMEDVRLVRLSDDHGIKYIGTYTAYNGRAIRPQVIITEDFTDFHIRPLTGSAISDKGLALFPEKINGQYVMAGRQGGRDISIMFSNDLYHWDSFKTLQQPEYAWDMVQLGNCGSPVKTDEGWLLLTHAVGPMRKYVLSMTLLDLDHPDRVIATLQHPLMEPLGDEREGYVPNVLYTCGMLAHAGKIIIPYAMSDSAISFATADQEALIRALKQKK